MIVISSELFAEAFNRWMDDFTNDPEKFASEVSLALRHVRERASGKRLSYGDEAAATLAHYLKQLMPADFDIDEGNARMTDGGLA